jgi:capsular exopolysaccharide synthesis family protein
MNLKAYIDILLRRKWVVAITVVVTMVVVTAGTWLMRPSYTATATLRIATASVSSTSSDYQFADRLINTYVIISTSKPLLDELDKELNLSKPPKITVQSIPNTELITISAEDPDPNLAVTAANTLGKILISQGSELYSGSGTTPSETLKVQVDQAETDLIQARVYYYQLLEKSPPDETAVAIANKDVDVKQQIYNTLFTQYEQLRVKEALQANLVSVVSPATFPEAPSKPNKPLYLGLGLVVSLMAGFGLVLIFENLDTTLFSSEQILAVTKLPMLGKIPVERNKKDRKIPLDGNSFYTEAYLRLRTNLLKTIEVSSCRSLLITSALQGEGKSTISTSLAFLLTQSGKKVVLIDGDLRIPSIHKIFDVYNSLGMSDYLQGKAGVYDVVQPTIFPGLSVISGGERTTEPVNLLSSKLMKPLIQELLNKYDLVLFDSPSVLAVSDSSVIAPLVDGVLLVVKRAFIGKEKLEATIGQLASVKAKLIGVIINGENGSENYYQYQSYSAIKK